MPAVRIGKQYVFDTSEGEKTLAQLFAGRCQLLVYHFMFGPGWTEGCPVCSFGPTASTARWRIWASAR